MSFADPEKRRKYQQRYKKNWRRRQAAMINPLLKFRLYLCLRFPNLRVGMGKFEGGFLITDRPEIQKEVEQHSYFGHFIFPLALDLDLVSSVMDSSEDE